MLAANVLSLPELASATGRSEAWWRRNWLRMHDRHAFPRRLPGLWGWPRPAVEAWCSSGGLSSRMAAAAANGNEPPASDLAAATARLEARFGLAAAPAAL